MELTEKRAPAVTPRNEPEAITVPGSGCGAGNMAHRGCASMLLALEAERAAIAREVHDNLGQELTILRLMMSRFKKEHFVGDEIPQSIVNEFSDLMAHVDRVAGFTRRLAYALHKDDIAVLGFTKAAEILVAEIKHGVDVAGKLEISSNWIDPPTEMAGHMYRCLQEMLNNMAKHSKAKRFMARIEYSEVKYTMTVLDDGIGLPQTILETLDMPRHIGLRSLSERAKLFNGEFVAQSRPYVAGTKLQLSFMV